MRPIVADMTDAIVSVQTAKVCRVIVQDLFSTSASAAPLKANRPVSGFLDLMGDATAPHRPGPPGLACGAAELRHVVEGGRTKRWRSTLPRSAPQDKKRGACCAGALTMLICASSDGRGRQLSAYQPARAI